MLKRPVPDGESENDERSEHNQFCGGEDRLYRSAAPHTKDVNKGEQQDHGRCARLDSREPERERMTAEVGSPLPDHAGQSGKEVGEVEQEPRGNRCNRRGLGHQELSPAVKKPHHGAVGAMEIDVLSAGFRDGRAELRVAERSEQAQHSRKQPYDEDHDGRSNVTEHIARHQEYGRADHGAGDHRRGAVKSQSFDEFGTHKIRSQESEVRRQEKEVSPLCSA